MRSLTRHLFPEHLQARFLLRPRKRSIYIWVHVDRSQQPRSRPMVGTGMKGRRQGARVPSITACEELRDAHLHGSARQVPDRPRIQCRPLTHSEDPASGILIGRDRHLAEWLGPLIVACASSKTPPEIETRTASAVQATSAGAIELSAGIRIISGLLSLLGVNGAALGAAYAGAHHLRLAFDDPAVRVVAPVAVGEWLLSAVPNEGNPLVKRYLGSADPSRHVRHHRGPDIEAPQRHRLQ